MYDVFFSLSLVIAQNNLYTITQHVPRQREIGSVGGLSMHTAHNQSAPNEQEDKHQRHE